MRTRTIVVLVVLGLALLVLPQMGGSNHDAAQPASRDGQLEPAITESPAPTEPAPPDKAPAPAPTTTTTVPPTTAPPEIERRGMGDPLAQRWPLIDALPKDAPGWRIDYRVEGERLVLAVTLRAVLNRPDQLEAYRAALRTYKAQALDWLRSMGADPGAYPIEGRPPEAAGF
jgi:hypothetical protein